MTKEKDKLVPVEEAQAQFPADLSEMTNKQLEAEQSRVDAEMRALDLEIKRSQVAQIKADRATKREALEARERATKALMEQRKRLQDKCTHRKGGQGANAVMNGAGTDAMFAVIKHQLPNADWFVLCQRCGKEWHKGSAGYENALQMPTDNQPSGSTLFLFHEAEVRV